MINRIAKVLIVCYLAVTLAIGMVYITQKALDKNINGGDINKKLSAKPFFDDKPTLLFDIPDENDKQAHMALALKLYQIACDNYNNVKQVATFVDYTTTSLNIPAKGYIHTVRKDGEYIASELCFVEEAIGAFLMSLFAADSTRFAKRVYYRDGMPNAYHELVTNPTPTYSLDNDNNIKYHVNWKKSKHAEIEAPDFRVLTEQNILLETIISASVSYNSQQGYYTLQLELDVENPKTTEKTLPKLAAGLRNDSAKYTQMIETIEIWDNGYPKYFLSQDNWEGKVPVINDMQALLYYQTYYYYDDDSCDYNNYQFMAEYRDRFVTE